MIIVIGAQGTIQNIDSFLQQLLVFSKKENLVIQALDAAVVYGADHLISATEHAQRAFDQRTNATNSLALEILLYAAGERQIQKAITKMGVKKGKQTIAFVLVDTLKRKPDKKTCDLVVDKLLRTFHLTSDEAVLEGSRDTLKRFGITDSELRTLPESRYSDLILEKVALVDVIK
jgi:KEOPS complex subunit Cgi121